MTTPPAALPVPWTTLASPGSQWVYSFQFENDDGTLMDISTKIFELVVRTSTRDIGTPAVRINSTSVTAQGWITVNTTTSTIQAVMTPTATSTLTSTDTYALTLWMNQGLTDQEAMVNGFLRMRPVAAA